MGANAENIANVTLFGKRGAVSIFLKIILCSQYFPELLAQMVFYKDLECIAKEFQSSDNVRHCLKE